MSQAIITKLAEILKQLGGTGSTTSAAPTSIEKITRVLAFSTTAVLGNAEVYTSPVIDSINYKFYSGLVTSDQAGSYFVQFSDDGIAWTSTSPTATSLTANGILALNNSGLLLRYFRIVYTNGATPQGSFKFATYLSPL